LVATFFDASAKAAAFLDSASAQLSDEDLKSNSFGFV
jgi:hypothetical protein